MNAPQTGSGGQFGEFAGLMAIILSAVAAVVAVMGLFSSVLEDLVPSIEDSKNTVAYVSLITVIVLLVLASLIRRQLSEIQARWLGLSTIMMLIATLGVFFPFRDNAREFIYRYPPSSQATADQTRHIRGEIHEEGRALIGRRSIAEAVHLAGGPDAADSQGIFWTEESKRAISGKLERLYISMVLLTSASVFTAGLTLWRLGGAKPEANP